MESPPFSTYAQRLANVPETSFDEQTVNTHLDIIPYPDNRDIYQTIPDIRIGLLDAYELRQCGLFHLIAERNSVLGKVQDKTRQLQYEILFLQGLRTCLATLDTNTDLYQQLVSIEQQKQQQIPQYLWNMLFTGEEWRKQFVINYQWINSNQQSGFHSFLDAIRLVNYLSQSTEQQAIIPSNQLDLLLQSQAKLYKNPYFGRLLYSLAQSTAWLNAITHMLKDHQESIYCGSGRNNQKAQYLNNVFYKYYSQDIQSYLATLSSQYQQLQPLLLELYQYSLQHGIPPAPKCLVIANTILQTISIAISNKRLLSMLNIGKHYSNGVTFQLATIKPNDLF
ncbi:DUF3080 family protein [Photobacterium damselae subsp. piscicida]|nr:DUF3080 family protein [Photobacterium damselae subsp. piscicida]MDP2569374.1 DUF3080 family protein [Photobacterium damselae subsp. piscicida]